jgi:hypothetical protein
MASLRRMLRTSQTSLAEATHETPMGGQLGLNLWASEGAGLGAEYIDWKDEGLPAAVDSMRMRRANHPHGSTDRRTAFSDAWRGNRADVPVRSCGTKGHSLAGPGAVVGV